MFDPLASLCEDEIHVVQFRNVEQLRRYSASHRYTTKRSTKLPSLPMTRDVIKLRVEWRHPTTGENFIKIVILSTFDNLRQQSCIYHPQLCSFMPDKQQRTHDMSSPICSQLSPYEWIIKIQIHPSNIFKYGGQITMYPIRISTFELNLTWMGNMKLWLKQIKCLL